MNTETKPQITINLQPVLEGYCRWIFEIPEKNNVIAITRNHDVGKHIFSHVLKSELPLKKRPRKDGYNLVTFELPLSHNCGYQLMNHFLYVDDWAETKINDFIRTDFNAWCRERFETGYSYGWLQKEITSTILRGINIRHNEANEAAIIKNDYRYRTKKEKDRFKMLLHIDC
jgi:hypothetical protein